MKITAMQTNALNQTFSAAIAKPKEYLNFQTVMLLFSATCILSMFYVSGIHKKTYAPSTSSPSANNNPVTSSVPAAGSRSSQSVGDIATDALAFYNMLSSSQQTTLQLTYTTTLARKWSNLPCGTSCRNGLQLGTNLTSTQYAAAMQIIKDALGTGTNNGYDEFHQMNLAEAYLHANGGGNGYDSVLRWIAFLNTPTANGPWMLQFGGHHYAANIAFNNGHVIGATPFFMGLEPKSFTYSSVTYDPLGDERDAFRALFATLSSSQLTTATIASAFSDCVMIPGETNNGTSVFPSQTIGQPLSSLSTTQQNLALAVIQDYVNDMDAATASTVMAGYASEIAQTYISYHGNGTSGSATSFLTAQGDYMRIAGPHVWIEFSCQGGVVIQGQIHYHTVWRDRSHDYGVDLAGPAIDSTDTTTVPTGIDVVSTQALTVFPNPTDNEITMQFTEALNDAGGYVYSLATGQLVKQIEHISGTAYTFNVSELAAGTYILKVRATDKNYSGKIVKY